jgi:hypothetical protein
MNSPALLPLLRACAAVALTCVAAARADDLNSEVIKFSDPGKPGTLRVSIPLGDVRIHGGDTKDVVVRTEAQPQKRPRKDGLRVLTDSTSYGVSEKDNIITLEAGADGWAGAPADFNVTVPRSTNIVVANAVGGDIVCEGVSGDIEIKSLQGAVRLDDIAGAALVETTNGEITASLRETHEGKPVSFTSMNGRVLLRVPADAKANVRLRTQNGTILTDFDEKALVTRVENTGGSRHRSRNALSPEAREAISEAVRASRNAAAHAMAALREAADVAREAVEDEHGDEGGDHAPRSMPPIPPVPPVPPIPVLPTIPTVTGGKLVTGTLNGGGPEITVVTMNGDVTLRKADGK